MSSGVLMPDYISDDPALAELWLSICPEDNRFTDQQLPLLESLIYWWAIARQAQEVINKGGGQMNIFDRIGTKSYRSDTGKPVPLVRKNPALDVLKDATNNVCKLADILGIERPQVIATKPSTTSNVVQLIKDDRAAKEKKAQSC